MPIATKKKKTAPSRVSEPAGSGLEEITSRIEKIEAAVAVLQVPVAVPDQQESPPDKDAPCSCTKKAAISYLEGFLWGTVFGLAFAALYFERSTRARRLLLR